MKNNRRKAAIEVQEPRKAISVSPRPAPSIWQWWHWAVALALFTLIAFEVYGPALNGAFVFDDSYLPFLIPEVASAPLRVWLGVRPFLMYSYWLNYQSAGLEPYWYHAIGVLLHTVNALLALAIVRRLLGWVGEEGWTREALALFAGALFLLHPVQTESVAYVTSRSETMSVFFFLAAFAVFVYRRKTAITFLESILVLILFGAACLTKEHTTVLPALLLLTDFYFNPGFNFEGAKRNWKLYVPIALGAVLGVMAVLRVLRASDSAGFQTKEFTWFQYLFSQFRAIWMYIRLFFFPMDQNADYNMAPSLSIFQHGAVFGLAGLLALVYLAWRFRREYPLASFGFIGFLVLLAPTSSVVPILDIAVERRLYLPFVCLTCVAVDFIRRWRTGRGSLAAVLCTVLCVAAFLTYQRSQVWAAPLPLWKDVIEKAPANSRARFQYAFALYQEGRCQEAIPHYEQVGRQQAPDERLLIDWALAYDCAMKPDEALAKLRQATQLTPSAHAYALIGMVHGKRGRPADALEALAAAEKLDPRFESIYLYRGNVWASTGDYARAAVEYRRTLAINPGNAVAQKALATAESNSGANRR